MLVLVPTNEKNSVTCLSSCVERLSHTAKEAAILDSEIRSELCDV
jgi:hypothetical protein